MVDNRLAFGIIGAGQIAQAYVQAFRHSTCAQLVAIADIRVAAANALAEVAGCRSYASYQAMHEGVKLDAVVICTPPVTHAEIGLYFLQQAVHVLCEKPLCLDVENAAMMTAAARRAGVYLTMGSKFRYVEDVIQARRLVASGRLGEIVLFENTFTACVDMTSRWNANPAISGGGVLIDNGTHSVDLMRHFFGPLVEVQAMQGTRHQGLGVEETACLFVRSASGVIGRIDLSWSIDKALDSYIKIYGTQGTVSVGWRVSKYRRSLSDQWLVFGKGYDKIQALHSQIENFARTIRGEDRLLVTAEDAVASVAVIAAAYEALRQNQWVGVEHRLDHLESSYGLVKGDAA